MNRPRHFPSTRWSMVSAASEDVVGKGPRAALEELCSAYWYPLYSYIRRQGYGTSDAEDLTQGFFAKVLSGELLQEHIADTLNSPGELADELEHLMSALFPSFR